MLAPPKDPDIDISEYQDALNQIPFGVKQQFPGYRWKPSSGVDMSWSSMTAGNSYSREHKVERWLVPGTAEPYYLEGQSQHIGKDWDLSYLSQLEGGNLGLLDTTREFSLAKRGSPDNLPLVDSFQHKTSGFENPKELGPSGSN
ncbi:hypothetical protein TWF718_009016 [Orbilia javanica]|uniref:Uncharacterized protein n=1 Tax=Orbilia javanica TaxID=47235 RepID=A0AAN8RG40_9PEZI